MVDALFCLIFAPKVAVRADYRQRFFRRLICDDGETILKLTHILTHQDLQIAQKIRTMMNESLCNEDLLRQAHLTQVDFYIKRLFAFNRLPVDVYEKLMILREEDGQTAASMQAPDANSAEMNFFLSDIDLTTKEGEGYDEIETAPKAEAEGNLGDDEENKGDDDLDDPENAQRMLEEVFDCRGMTSAQITQR